MAFLFVTLVYFIIRRSSLILNVKDFPTKSTIEGGLNTRTAHRTSVFCSHSTEPSHAPSCQTNAMSSGRALIIVDMSNEQVSPIEYNRKIVIQNCRKLALNENDFFDLCIDSKLWLLSPEESSLSWVWPETAKTMFVAGSEGASLIPELADISPVTFVPKNNYSCFANSKLLSTLRDAHIDEVYICGINTDYCVFATAMDSFQHMFRTFVVKDAVTSVRGKEAHVEGLHNLERHFSSNALVLTDDIV